MQIPEPHCCSPASKQLKNQSHCSDCGLPATHSGIVGETQSCCEWAKEHLGQPGTKFRTPTALAVTSSSDLRPGSVSAATSASSQALRHFLAEMAINACIWATWPRMKSTGCLTALQPSPMQTAGTGKTKQTGSYPPELQFCPENLIPFKDDMSLKLKDQQKII